MSEFQSSRRSQAQSELGLNEDIRQEQKVELALQKEELRREEKEVKRQRIEMSSSYRLVQGIAKWMDKYFLDPILGFVPGVGDFISTVFVLPFIYVSAVKVRSLPLTLAVVFNVLKDAAIGMIPFWIGNIADFFNHSYMQNFRLIVGYVEDDRDVINEVNRKAVWTAILIAIFCVIIYLLVRLVVLITEWIGGWFA